MSKYNLVVGVIGNIRSFGLAANAAIVLVVSLAACYIPACWAGRVDPALVLRND